jgi:hypothetical protein
LDPFEELSLVSSVLALLLEDGTLTPSIITAAPVQAIIKDANILFMAELGRRY